MSNHYFQFKQFTVQQEYCAMKVTTDGCLFGAINAKYLMPNVKRILDIGTGTGLLSLMIAQKNNTAIIDAVEIDEQAANQAAFNFQASPWRDKLHMHHSFIQQFQSVAKYDLIISNPPFFNNDLKSDDAKRNLALHSSDLNLEELLAVIKNNLTNDGKFSVLLPYHRSEYFETLCLKENFYAAKKILVKQTPHHNYFRSILLFSRKKQSLENNEIIIKDEFNDYTNEFKNLLEDYYLHL
jgi:tRNA1Val (adenine37-N6)-methyltransferase